MMREAQLVSIQVGRAREHGVPGATDPFQQPWVSAFAKEPVTGPVRVGPEGVAGDQQADTRSHGGPDMAVLCYSADHYPLWREELGRPEFPCGAFAENFTISGVDEDTVCIGDTFDVGAARLQVTQARVPCWKIARRWQMKDLTERVHDSVRIGWYARVLVEGQVAAGDPVMLRKRPCPEWSVRRAYETLIARGTKREAAAALAECPFLAARWREVLRQAASSE